MGVHPNISHDKFPKQGSWLNSKVRVCFNYDTSVTISGIMVRDDMEEPGLGIIRLADGRYVRTTECMWSTEPDRGVPADALSDAELLACELLGEAWNAIIACGIADQEGLAHIHALQRLVMSQLARRAHPEVFTQSDIVAEPKKEN